MKKHKKNKGLKSEKGITLLVLVITIIIIIILATITINFAFGDDGLIEQAESTKDSVEESTRDEESKRNSLAQELEGLIPFQPTDTPEPEEGGDSFTMSYGVIEIKWLQGTTNNVTGTPNAPKVKTISNGTMELVKYVEGGTTEQERWVAGTDYEYIAGTGTGDNNQSRWANARVTINGIDSYFVWIPRYAYRIVYFKDEPSKNEYKNGTITEEQAIADGKIVGYSDSRGIVTADGKKVDSVNSTTHTMVSKDYFMPHPAFLDGSENGLNNGYENGEWDRELEGLWIGKYEASRSTATSSSTGSGTTLKVQPGVRSLSSTQIRYMYTYSQNYSIDLESHMLKNSEWGAVAYLTESAYGRNGTEITQNTSSYITGSAEGSDGNTNTDYTSSDGQKASSTGNVWGIYDLSGGKYEYVAGYYNGSDANTTYIGYGSSFASIGGDSTKYATTYNSSGNSTTSAGQNYKYGDATYETRSWHSDNALFVRSGSPFFNRGGSYGISATNAGVFCYYSITGGNYSYNGFRLSLTV